MTIEKGESTNSTQTAFRLSRPAMVSLVVAGLILGTGCSQNSPSNQLNAQATGIIGGQEVSPMANDGYSKSIAGIYNLKEGYICTASILSDQVLITAAHCLNGPLSNLIVLFGTRLEENAPPSSYVVRAVRAYRTSPLHVIRKKERLDRNDIALVKFSGGLPPDYYPATVLNDTSVLQAGTAILIAGYGMDDGIKKSGTGVLRSVETTTASVVYGSTEILVDQTNGKGACHGDSGGPAYVKIDGKWVLFGITSRGVDDTSGTCGVSAAFTLIPFYRNWSRRAAQQLL